MFKTNPFDLSIIRTVPTLREVGWGLYKRALVVLSGKSRAQCTFTYQEWE